ncbi:MAG: hypothetical protein OEZ59_00270 [Deltaproteobacteria bacterium]|nr:hypothetical protein [Deltaproteobacteria bacterium]
MICKNHDSGRGCLPMGIPARPGAKLFALTAIALAATALSGCVQGRNPDGNASATMCPADAAPSVLVHVNSPDGRALPGVEVMFSHDGSTLSPAKEEQQGRFSTMIGAPGAFLVQARIKDQEDFQETVVIVNGEECKVTTEVVSFTFASE